VQKRDAQRLFLGTALAMLSLVVVQRRRLSQPERSSGGTVSASPVSHPEECGMESKAAFSSTVQDSSFPNPTPFPNLLMKGETKTREREPVL